MRTFYIFSISVLFILVTFAAGGAAHGALPGSFGRMEAEAIQKINSMNVSPKEKARMIKEVRATLKEAALEHQYAVEAVKRTQAYLDAGGIAPESFKAYVKASSDTLGMMGDGALASETLFQVGQLGDDMYLPEEAKGTAQALTTMGAVMQKAGDKLNNVLPGLGEVVSGYGQAAQKLAGMTSGIAEARTRQVEGYFQNIRGGSAEDRLLNETRADGLARELDLWESGIEVARADFGGQGNKYFLKVGDVYEEVKDLNALKKVVGDWRVTHNGTVPDEEVLKTLLEGGTVREKYATWDMEELDQTAEAKIEVRLLNDLLKKSIGDSEFYDLTSEEQRDLRNQIHDFRRDIESLGGVVDDDRLAILFRNGIGQGNQDRVLNAIVYEQDPETYDRALEEAGKSLADIRSPHELQDLVKPKETGGPETVPPKIENDRLTGAGESDSQGEGSGGFSFFKTLRDKGTTEIATVKQEQEEELWKPGSYVLTRTETREFKERKENLKENVENQIKKVKNQIKELQKERDKKIAETMETQKHVLVSKDYSRSYDPDEIEYKGKVYKDRLEVLEVQRQERLTRLEAEYQKKQLIKSRYEAVSQGQSVLIGKPGPYQEEGTFARQFVIQAGPNVAALYNFYYKEGEPSAMSIRYYGYDSDNFTIQGWLDFLTKNKIEPREIGREGYDINREGQLVKKGYDYNEKRFLDDPIEAEITDPDLLDKWRSMNRSINDEYDWLIEFNKDIREAGLESIRDDYNMRESELQDQLDILEDRQAVLEGKSDQSTVDRYYSSEDQEDPGVKELVGIIKEFNDVRNIEANPTEAITVETKEDWDRLWERADFMTEKEPVEVEIEPARDIEPDIQAPHHHGP